MITSYSTSDPAHSTGLLVTEDFFMAFACGTFTAISYVEILGSELHGRPKPEVIKRVSVVVAGFAVIAISSIVEAVFGVEE